MNRGALRCRWSKFVEMLREVQRDILKPQSTAGEQRTAEKRPARTDTDANITQSPASVPGHQASTAAHSPNNRSSQEPKPRQDQSAGVEAEKKNRKKNTENSRNHAEEREPKKKKKISKISGDRSKDRIRTVGELRTIWNGRRRRRPRPVGRHNSGREHLKIPDRIKQNSIESPLNHQPQSSISDFRQRTPQNTHQNQVSRNANACRSGTQEARGQTVSKNADADNHRTARATSRQQNKEVVAKKSQKQSGKDRGGEISANPFITNRTQKSTAQKPTKRTVWASTCNLNYW